MIYRKVVILVLSLISILLFFATPYYNNWLFLRVLNPHLSIFFQSQHLDTAMRKELRYGPLYNNCLSIVSIVNHAKIKDPLILLPPKNYMLSMHIGDFDLDPPEFYYFTGLRSVTANSADVNLSNLYISPNNEHKLVIKRIHSRQERDTLVALYKRFGSL